MLDCLISYVPKFQNRYKPLGNYTSVQWLPLGIFALADALEKAGMRSRIIHLGLEKALNPIFRLTNYLTASSCRVAAFSLHFHQQLHDTLRVIRAAKKRFTSIFVVVGGMTASFFAEDVMREFSSVDGVIKGEGEVPLVLLVRALSTGEKDLSAVPNLLWRRGGDIVENTECYVASKEQLDSLDFCNLSRMEHHSAYVSMPKIFTRLRVPHRLKWKISRLLSQRKRAIFFALPAGRGCVTNCFYCGGGARAQRIVNARREVVFRDPERVVADIRRLIDYGYRGAYVSFDPPPKSDAYYRGLFAMIRSGGLSFDLPFSSWGLPSRGFIDEYGKTFSAASYIAISPETGSETLRKKIRGIYFSNDELLQIVRYAEDRGVRTDIFFSLGLPGETKQDFDETVRLKETIEKRFRLASIDAFAVEIEPAAPWHMDPERHGIVLYRKGLGDFLSDQREASYSSMTSLGYYRTEYRGEAVSGRKEFAGKVLDVKCRTFCRQRKLCRAANLLWGAARLIGLSEEGDEEV